MFKQGYFLPITTAAAVLLAGLLLTMPTRQSTVEAATILASLRSTLYRGLSLVIKDVEVDGIRIDGQVGLGFDQPFRMRDLADETLDTHLQPNLLTGDLRVEFTENAEELAGWSANVALAFDKNQQWVYVQSDDVAPLAQELGPMIMMIGPAIQNGLLLDLNGALEGGGPAGLFAGGAPPAPSGSDAQTTPSPSPLLDVNARVHWSVEIVDASECNTPATTRASVSASFHPIQRSDDHPETPFEELLTRLLEGGLTADDVDALVTQIEKNNARAKVELIEPGLYALTMHDLDKLDPSYANEPMLQNTVLTIAYREGTGVEWIKLANIGAAGGEVTIRLLPNPDEITVARREDHVVQGRTTVLDVGAWAKSLNGTTMPTPIEQDSAPE